MTPAELAAWRSHMGYSQRAAARALGLALTTYQQMESGISRQTGKLVDVDRRTALACAALAADLDEWRAPGGEAPLRDQ